MGFLEKRMDAGSVSGHVRRASATRGERLWSPCRPLADDDNLAVQEGW